MKRVKKINHVKENNGSMLTQKTNEDFNKKQPMPNDFNENKKGEDENLSPEIKLKKHKK